MSELSVSTILKALIVGILRQGKVLTWDLICLTREVWTFGQGEHDCITTNPFGQKVKYKFVSKFEIDASDIGYEGILKQRTICSDDSGETLCFRIPP